LTGPFRNANWITLSTCFQGFKTVAKPELGTKRLCAGCGVKFYDLNKDPITCPKCGTVFEVVTVAPRGRPEAAAAAAATRAPVQAAEPEVAETPEAEFVSLEEADAEAEGAKKPAGDGTEVEDVEIEDVEGGEDDSTFIEETEEEDTDVTEIIGGDIENEEET
jgi:uncharacterized protein (TIGR02300 family)